MSMMQTRRRFLTTLSAAGAAGLVRAPPSLAAEGALETTIVRILKIPGICLAPQYASEELLRAEGFTEIRYVEVSPTVIPQAIGRGEADFSTTLAVDLIGPKVREAIGCSEQEARRVLRLIEDHQAELMVAWRRVHG